MPLTALKVLLSSSRKARFFGKLFKLFLYLRGKAVPCVPVYVARKAYNDFCSRHVTFFFSPEEPVDRALHIIPHRRVGCRFPGGHNAHYQAAFVLIWRFSGECKRLPPILFPLPRDPFKIFASFQVPYLHALRTFLPFLRLRAMTALPEEVLLLLRKPCFLLRFRFDLVFKFFFTSGNSLFTINSENEIFDYNIPLC